MTIWLKMAEAVEYSKLSREVLTDAIKRGDLASYAPTPSGRDIRLKTDDIDAWIESKPYEPRSA